MYLFTDLQIRQMTSLIQEQMTEFLGYEVSISELSKEAGDEVKFKMTGLSAADKGTKRVQDKFDDVCSEVKREVGKLFGEN